MVEHAPHNRVCAGPTPAGTTSGISSVDRTVASKPTCQGFESSIPCQPSKLNWQSRWPLPTRLRVRIPPAVPVLVVESDTTEPREGSGPGSSPGEDTRSLHLAVRKLPPQGGDTGSSPVGTTSRRRQTVELLPCQGRDSGFDSRRLRHQVRCCGGMGPRQGSRGSPILPTWTSRGSSAR